MLLWLSERLVALDPGFGVFRYLTFRTILAVLTGLGIALAVGPVMIRRLTVRQIGQSVRADGPLSHLPKAGTPTMGGVLLIVGVVFATLLWGNLGNHFVWLALAVTVAFGAVGGADDYRKVIRRNAHGLPARWKFFWQSVAGLVAAGALFALARAPVETQLIVPFFKGIGLSLGYGYVVLAYLVMVGASNAVNLTDGLDGLAILPSVLVTGALGLLAYLTGNVVFAEYLQIPYIPGAGELVVFCGALVGAGLGFLWFNTYPAQIFMGDVGALALGGAMGFVAVVVRQEVVLFVMGGLFVAETLSVVVQVASYRLTGRRVFRMAPLHHHFELMGWPEPRVVIRLWIVSLVLVLVGMSTLKLR